MIKRNVSVKFITVIFLLGLTAFMFGYTLNPKTASSNPGEGSLVTENGSKAYHIGKYTFIFESKFADSMEGKNGYTTMDNIIYLASYRKVDEVYQTCVHEVRHNQHNIGHYNFTILGYEVEPLGWWYELQEDTRSDVCIELVSRIDTVVLHDIYSSP